MSKKVDEIKLRISIREQIGRTAEQLRYDGLYGDEFIDGMLEASLVAYDPDVHDPENLEAKHHLTGRRPLTSKQQNVFEFIKSRGGKTRLKDIQEEFGYKQLSSSQRQVDALIKKGYLLRKGHTLEVK